MSTPAWNAVNVVAAGEARFDGAAAVITLGTLGTNPTWTSMASNAAWLALFGQPASGLQQYVSHADFYVEGADIFVTRAAGVTAPTAVNGFKWPIGYFENLRNCPELLRNMQFFLPAASKLWVCVYWGAL